jgi:hypothetical protein
MRSMFGSTTGRSGEGGGGTVRSLYEAARREVEADPMAALTKYQPSWLESLSPRHARIAERPGRAKTTRR